MPAELTIPRSTTEDLWAYVILGIVIGFSALALADVIMVGNCVAPLIWLGFLSWIVWSGITGDGGARKMGNGDLG